MVYSLNLNLLTDQYLSGSEMFSLDLSLKLGSTCLDLKTISVWSLICGVQSGSEFDD